MPPVTKPARTPDVTRRRVAATPAPLDAGGIVMPRNVLNGLVVITICLLAVDVQTAAREGFVTLGLFPEHKGRMERLAEELASELEPHAGDAALDSLVVERAGEQDFDLVVLGDENPMISDECYKLALRHAATEMMMADSSLGPSEAVRKGMAHVVHGRARAATHGRTYGEFFRHVVKCDEWCEPMVVSLEQCHIEAVARLRPWPVFFGFNTSVVDERFLPELEVVSAELLRSPDSRVLVVGRGSRIGNRDHNRRLSRERAEAVRDRLVTLGAPADRIQALWLGWEPPQIVPEVARAYNLTDAWLLYGRQALNQSVMMVVYTDATKTSSL